MLAREPKLRAEVTQLETDAGFAKDVLPLVAACTEWTGEFPVYARGRVQTVVRQTFGRPESAGRKPLGQLEAAPQFMPRTDSSDVGSRPTKPSRLHPLKWDWRLLLLGAAGATAVVFLVLLIVVVGSTPVNESATVSQSSPVSAAAAVSESSPVSAAAAVNEVGRVGYAPVSAATAANEVGRVGVAPVCELAMLGTTGGIPYELATFATRQKTWKESSIQRFFDPRELEAWEKSGQITTGRR
jgi:hypothetical protein